MTIATNPVPRTWTNVPDHTARLADAVNNILRGKLNNTGDLTLTASSATSTLTDIRIGTESVIVLMPKTANAAAELGNGTLYFGTPGDGTVTVNHANNAQTDRTYRYAVIG